MDNDDSNVDSPTLASTPSSQSTMEDEFRTFEESVNKEFKRLKSVLETRRKEILSEGAKIMDAKINQDVVGGIGTLSGTWGVRDAIAELRLLPSVVYGPGSGVKVQIVSSLSSEGVFTSAVFDPDGQRALDLRAISKMIEHDLETYPTAPLSQPKVGSLCCARFFQDQKWYRARIQSIVNVAKAKVVFLDYGTTGEVPVNEIFPLKDKYRCLPFQIMICRLSEDTSLLFSREAKWKFNDMCRTSSSFLAKISQEVMVDGFQQYVCEIFYNDVNISKVILELSAISNQAKKEAHPIIHRDIRLKTAPSDKERRLDSLPQDRAKVSLPMKGVTVLTRKKIQEKESMGASVEGCSETSGCYVEGRRIGNQLDSGKPVGQEQVSVEQECKPVEEDRGSIEQEKGPIEQEHNSVKHECEPVEQECEPVEQECEPVEQECEPVEQECEPVKQECEPVEQECEPVEQECERVEQDCESADQEFEPVEQVQKPIEQEQGHIEQEHEPITQRGVSIVQEHEPVGQKWEAVEQNHGSTEQEHGLVEQAFDDMEQEHHMVKQIQEIVDLDQKLVMQDLKHIEEDLKHIEQDPKGNEQDLKHVEQDPVPLGSNSYPSQDLQVLPVASGGISKEFVSNPIPAHPSVQQGNKVHLVIVSPLQRDGTFWAQLAIDTSSEEGFDEMTKSLQLSVQKHFQHRVTNWRRGEYCSARFSEDKIWYRAQIEELRGDKILVRFVDFGNSEELKAAYVVPLEKDFRELPYQSIRCHLSSEPDQVFTEKMCTRFEKVTFNSEENPVLAVLESVQSDVVDVCLMMEVPNRDPLDLNNEVLTADPVLKSMEFTAVSAKSDQSWADRMDELNSPTSVVTEVMFPVSEPAPVWTPEPGPIQIPENSNHLTKSEKSYSSGYPHGAIHTRQHPDSISHTRPTRGSLGVARILKSSLRKSVVPDHIRRRDQQALSRGSSNRLSPVEKSVIQPFSENWEEEVKQVHTSTSATPQVDAQPRPDMVKLFFCELPKTVGERELKGYVSKYCSVKEFIWRSNSSGWMFVDRSKAELAMQRVKEEIYKDTNSRVVLEYAKAPSKKGRHPYSLGHSSQRHAYSLQHT